MTAPVTAPNAPLDKYRPPRVAEWKNSSSRGGLLSSSSTKACAWMAQLAMAEAASRVVNGIDRNLRAIDTDEPASPGDRPAARSRNCFVDDAFDS